MPKEGLGEHMTSKVRRSNIASLGEQLGPGGNAKGRWAELGVETGGEATWGLKSKRQDGPGE